MKKQLLATAVAGTVAGAALMGVSTVALAGQPEETPREAPGNSAMGSMMSDPQLREQMMSFMSEMMSDPDMREQMRSMMADTMPDMGDMHGGMGGMGGMDSEGGGMGGMHSDHGDESDGEDS